MQFGLLALLLDSICVIHLLMNKRKEYQCVGKGEERVRSNSVDLEVIVSKSCLEEIEF